jgi:GTPase involved in cell partitioning and DNA repair
LRRKGKGLGQIVSCATSIERTRILIHLIDLDPDNAPEIPVGGNCPHIHE